MCVCVCLLILLNSEPGSEESKMWRKKRLNNFVGSRSLGHVCAILASGLIRSLSRIENSLERKRDLSRWQNKNLNLCQWFFFIWIVYLLAQCRNIQWDDSELLFNIYILTNNDEHVKYKEIYILLRKLLGMKIALDGLYFFGKQERSNKSTPEIYKLNNLIVWYSSVLRKLLFRSAEICLYTHFAWE